jgi:UDP:flavonoid glycosyltransferase YjiC (YdhE family)
MHLIVSAFGSYGDVLPMVGLGSAMRQRGWRVQAVVNPYFQQIVADAGLELLPLGTAEEYLALTAHPDLWHPTRGMKLVLSKSLEDYLKPAWKLVSDNYRPGETVIAAHGLDLGSRILNESRGAPLATVHLAPFAVKTLYETPLYMHAPSVSRGPRWWRAFQFWMGNRWFIDPVAAPPVNRLRAEQGLAPVKGIFDGWNNSPQLVLGMWPEWFGAAQPDYPPHTALVGFPLWDPRPADGLPSEVSDFLAAGEPPLAFAPGSANVQGREFFVEAIGAAERLGRRAMLLTKYPEQLPDRLPPGVKRFGFLPFSLLLPQVAALVHHGGIGTCGQALAAGVPQVVMPMAYDQLDNGSRLARLGVGAVVPRKRFTAERVAGELQRLLGSSTVRDRCADLASRCDGPATLDAACDALERLLERPSARRVVTEH